MSHRKRDLREIMIDTKRDRERERFSGRKRWREKDIQSKR